jgi:hypothetical protein
MFWIVLIVTGGATVAASLFVWESFYLRLLGFVLFLAGCLRSKANDLSVGWLSGATIGTRASIGYSIAI